MDSNGRTAGDVGVHDPLDRHAAETPVEGMRLGVLDQRDHVLREDVEAL